MPGTPSWIAFASGSATEPRASGARVGRKKPLPDQTPSGPFNAAFADLQALKDDLEAASSEQAVTETATESRVSTDEPPTPHAREPALALAAARAKVVVQRERKGHGGKTITRIAGLGGDRDALEALARTLARRLGVGAKVEGDAIWVQGDQVQRLQEALQQLGARRVIAGN